MHCPTSAPFHHIQDGFFSVFAGETGQDSVSESPEPETGKSESWIYINPSFIIICIPTTVFPPFQSLPSAVPWPVAKPQKFSIVDMDPDRSHRLPVSSRLSRPPSRNATHLRLLPPTSLPFSVSSTTRTSRPPSSTSSMSSPPSLRSLFCRPSSLRSSPS